MSKHGNLNVVLVLSVDELNEIVDGIDRHRKVLLKKAQSAQWKAIKNKPRWDATGRVLNKVEGALENLRKSASV